MDESKTGAWRKNAAAIIVDAQGNILLGKDPGRNQYWHFPQGGVMRGENLEHTIAREVWEEVGIRPSEYKILAHGHGFRYAYPPSHRRSGRWIGQEQTYFLLLCHKIKPKSDVSRSNEFSETKWFAQSEIRPQLFPKFKRSVAKQVLKHFFVTNQYLPKTPQQRHTVPVKHIMELSPDISRYLVTPGKKLKMQDYSPSDRSLFQGTKEESALFFDNLKTELQDLQKRLYAQHKHRVLVILQGMDASGKDGCVRQVFSCMDPHGMKVISFKRPTALELDHDFLWRVHPQVPGNGEVVVFNRSHYEDIIAVRVKKLFDDAVWQRRYKYVVDFEDMLVGEGTTIIKIFLNISKEEQKERLESRLKDSQKLWKFEPSDLADRAMWNEFQAAYQDLLEKTSTEAAPWYIIPGDRKWYRNLIVAKLLVEKLRTLNLQFPEPKVDPSDIIVHD